MRKIMIALLCFCFVLPVFAQEEDFTPYEIALQRIEEARVSGATELYFYGLGLTELPPEIGSVQSLESLFLDKNKLRDLPPEIYQLENLVTLVISDNELEDISSQIAQLSHLEFLILSNNHLEALPREIGTLYRLKVLNVANNYLSDLPSELSHLLLLCNLNLRNNQIQYLPTSLFTLHGLLNGEICPSSDAGIHLEGNPLIFPPSDVVQQGTQEILYYLYRRNEAWWHIQRLILGGTSFTGIITAVVLGFRWRNRRRKSKKRNMEKAN